MILGQEQRFFLDFSFSFPPSKLTRENELPFCACHLCIKERERGLVYSQFVNDRDTKATVIEAEKAQGP